MGAVSYVARAGLRARWRSLAALVLLAGTAGGVATAGVAGAERTRTAVARFLDATDTAEVELGPPGDLGPQERLELAGRLAALPPVGATAMAAWAFHCLPPEHAGAGGSPFPLITYVALDEAAFVDISRPRVLRGRMPRAADELALNEAGARRLGLGVGDALRLQPVPSGEIEGFFGGCRLDDPPPLVGFEVTGVVRAPDDLRTLDGGSTPEGTAYLTAAYWAEAGDDLEFFGPAVHAMLVPGATVDDVHAASREVVDVADTARPVRTRLREEVQDAIDVEVLALRLFAGVVALVGLLLAGQLAGRTLAGERDRQPVLRALGAGRSARAWAAAAPLAVAAAGAGVVAAVLAVLGSAWFPIGVAARAEPDPGLRVEALAVAAGAAATVVAVAGVACAAAWTAAGRRAGERGPGRPSRLVALALRVGLGPAPVVGVRLATEPGHGPTAVPVRAVLAGAVLGTTGVVAALTFAAALDRLGRDPAQYGWSFDGYVGTEDDDDTFDETIPVLEDIDLVDEISVASVGHGIGPTDREFTVFGWQRHRGSLDPVLAAGRLPERAGEVALGRTTARQQGVDIGDVLAVRASPASRPVNLRVVGLVVLPGGDNDFTGGLGDGAVMTYEAMAAVSPDPPRNVYVFTYDEGVDVDEGRQAFEAVGLLAGRPNPGAEIASRVDVVEVPVALAGVILVLAVGTLLHALWAGTRRRRRDLAVLRAIGFRRRDLGAAVVVQAYVIGGAALLCGAVLGRAAGASTWGAVARDLGVDDATAWPSPVTLAVGVVGSVVVVTAVALGPALAARRVRPAAALRAE